MKNLYQQLKIFYIRIQNRREEKKLNSEIPKLVDFLISYMNAGLHPYQALELASKKINFSTFIRFPLFKIVSLYARGCSFSKSIDLVRNEMTTIPARKNFSLLLVGLKVSFLKGTQSVKILEKIKTKAEDEIQFQRKLRVITAQMRLQANVILFTPLVLALIMILIAPNYILIFFNSRIGNTLLSIMIFLNICGYITLKKIMRVQ